MRQQQLSIRTFAVALFGALAALVIPVGTANATASRATNVKLVASGSYSLPPDTVSGTMTSRVNYSGPPRNVAIAYAGHTHSTPIGATDVRVYMNWQFYGPITGLTVSRWPRLKFVSHYVTGPFADGSWVAVMVKECDSSPTGNEAPLSNGSCSISFGLSNPLRIDFSGGTPSSVLGVQASTAYWPPPSTTGQISISPQDSASLPQ
jgi:hypothetical protein